MDHFQFVAALVSSLAWPISAFAMALILRRPVVALMNRATTAEGFGAKLTFSDRADAARAAVETETASGVIATHVAVLDHDIVIPPAGTSERVLQLKDELAGTSATGTVIVAWRDLETAVEELAKAVEIKGSARQGFPRVLSKLVEAGHISAVTADSITSLRNLRNEVAHARAGAPLTLSDAAAYRTSVDSVISTIISGLD